MRSCITTVLLCMVSIASQSAPLDKAIEMVDSFFGDFKTISKEKQGEKVSHVMVNLTENYTSLSSEISVPNDFNVLGFRNELKTGISLTRYVLYFRQMFNDESFRNCTFEYYVLPQRSTLLHEHFLSENDTIAHFSRIVVRRVFTKEDSVLGVFTDTLIINNVNMEICRWTNDSKSHNNRLWFIEQQKIDAERAFVSKDYNKAQSIYESIIQNYPEEGLAYYKLALLLHCRRLNTNGNDENIKMSIKEYLNMAIKYGDYKTIKLAQDQFLQIKE